MPFTQIWADLTASSVPNFAFLLPDAENEAHDCPTGGSLCPDNDKLAAADNWLKSNPAPLSTTPRWRTAFSLLCLTKPTPGDLTNGGGHVAEVIA